MTCDHEGEHRAHIEIHRLEDGWAAHAFVRGKALPELVAISEDDPREAVEVSGSLLGLVLLETDQLLDEAA